MNREQPSTTPQCQIHQKPALFVNSNNIQTIIQQEFPCEKCFEDYIFTNTNQQNNNKNESLLKQIKINRKILEVFEQMLVFYENNISKEINSIQNFVKDQQEFLINIEILQQTISQNEEELHQLENDVEMISIYLSTKLSDLSLASNINNFEIILKQKQIYNFSDTFSQNSRDKNQKEFEIIPLHKTDHNKQCQAIAFDYGSMILAAGYQNQIRIFDKNLNEFQILDEHKKNITYLQFMKTTNKQFISCSMDGQISFWDQNNIYNKWVLVQVINDSQHSITCIKFNNQQNMFISGGVDCSVRFYKKSIQNKWQFIDSIVYSSYVVDLSFNLEYSQLLISEYNNIVSVMNKIKKYKWNLRQQINIGSQILKIQSVSLAKFALLEQKNHNVYIFNEQGREGFVKIQQINLEFENFEDNSFDMILLNKYSFAECLLVCGGQQIHILTNVSKQFHVTFTYKIPAILNYVRVSEDKKHFSYWEKQSNKIHVMRIKKY